MATSYTSAALQSLAFHSLRLTSESTSRVDCKVEVVRSKQDRSLYPLSRVVSANGQSAYIRKHNLHDADRWRYWNLNVPRKRSWRRVTYWVDEHLSQMPLFEEVVLTYLEDGHFDRYLQTLRFPDHNWPSKTEFNQVKWLDDLKNVLGPTAVQRWHQLERTVLLLNQIFGRCKCDPAWVTDARVLPSYNTVEFAVTSNLQKFTNQLNQSNIKSLLKYDSGGLRTDVWVSVAIQ